MSGREAGLPPQASEANDESLRRISSAEPVLVGIQPAGELVPGLRDGDFLHAGPPLEEGWAGACGALRGAILGRMLLEGMADSLEAAQRLASEGAFVLKCANDHGLLGTFAGLISRKTPVFVVEDRKSGRRAGAAINEGRGKALRYGATDAETLCRLRWLEGGFAEILDSALRAMGGVRIGPILEQALHMGDDGHSRQKAASALFVNAVAAPLTEAGYPAKETSAVIRFIAANEIFFLPLAIAAAKVAMRAAEGVPGSTIVTCLAANGIRFGIQISGLAGRWFTAPVPGMHGRFFEGFQAEDAGPLIGDSLVSEAIGLGALAMAGAPALAPYVGGTVEESLRLALTMYDITLAEHPRYKIPALNYRGTPFGIDAQLVVNKRIAPIFNAGMAHTKPGMGQIGAGYVQALRHAM